ncbi:hypothetical protein [Micromonospora sp. NPDC048830]|uniref:hypothetical protein n=1 Tax=Micromonospora sp. NPDC048830 TaxID=3364257 RepID=UPI003718114B
MTSAGFGGLLGGPVAAVVVGAYGALAARAVVRRHRNHRIRLARRHSLDQLCALAADLRAGVPVLTAAATIGVGSEPGTWTGAQPNGGAGLHVGARSAGGVGLLTGALPSGGASPLVGALATGGASPLTGALATGGASPLTGALATGGASPLAGVLTAGGTGPLPAAGDDAPASGDPDTGADTGADVDRLGRLARAAVRLADRTGAPLADLVERIEADARATDRGLAAAAAQAAGARATAWLLAALPLGGIGLGYGVGVDPVAVLLHTTVGGACAVAAVVLQIVGLFWAERLGATPGGNP